MQRKVKMYIVVVSYWVTVQAATLVFIPGHCSAISSARDGRSGNVNKLVNILRRKSLVSTDTVCNNFVRQS